MSSGRAHRRRPVEDEIDPELLRYAPRPPRRFLWARRLLIVAVLAGVVWAGYNLARDWINDQYFVGAEGGEVAVFRGLDTSIGPIAVHELHHVAEGLPVEALPPLYQTQIEDSISAEDLSDAEAVIASLRQQACRLHPPAATAEPEPTASPTPDPTVSPDPAATQPAQTGQEEEPAVPAPADFPGLICTGVDDS